MTSRIPTVSDYMTVAPFSIGPNESLRSAVRRMKEHGIRHLPVVEHGQLSGVLSSRDIALAEALGQESFDELSVEQAMSPDPFAVAPAAPLSRVVRAMAANRYGCAVIVEQQEVKGIFTTVDALTAFARVLEHGEPREGMAPSEVRTVILAEHERLRALLDRTETSALRASAQSSDAGAGAALRDVSHHLLTALLSHFDLENHLLAPALAETSGYGAERAQRLRQEHDEQERLVRGLMTSSADPSYPLSTLAAALNLLVARLRNDMELEERTMLDASLLRDDCIEEDCATG